MQAGYRFASVLALVLAAACQPDIAGGPEASRAADAGTASIVLPGSGYWSTGAPLPTARLFASAATLGNRIYVAGGIDDAGVRRGLVERYRPSTDTWDTIPSMPDSLDAGHQLLALGGYLYVVGGYSTLEGVGNRKLWRYNPATGNWKAMAEAPHNRQFPAAAAVAGKICVFGGFLDNGPVSASVDCWTESSNTWAPAADMPVPLKFHGTAVSGSLVYVYGGYFPPDFPNQAMRSWDALTDTWAFVTGPDASGTGRPGPAMGFVDGHLYIIGSAWPYAQAFSPSNGVWTELAAGPATAYVAGAVHEGVLYQFGGFGASCPANTCAFNDAFHPGDAGNHAPILFANTPWRTEIGVGLNLDASSTYDPDGDPVSWAWDFGDGTTSTATSATHAWTSYGNFTVRVTVSDATLSRSHRQVVRIVNRRPVVSFALDTIAFVNEAITGSGAFTDWAGDTWNATVRYGAETSLAALPLSGQDFALGHTWTTPGMRTVTVRVTDNGGAEGSHSRTIAVVTVSGGLALLDAMVDGLQAGAQITPAEAVSLHGKVAQARHQFYLDEKLEAQARLGQFSNAILRMGVDLNDYQRINDFTTRVVIAILAS